MIKKILTLFIAVLIISAAMIIPVSASSAGGSVGGGASDCIRPTVFTVPVENAETGAKVIFALYKGKVLVDFKIAIYDGNAVSFQSREIYDKIKVFVWSEDGIEPLFSELDYSQIIYGEEDSIDIDLGQVEDVTGQSYYIRGVKYLDTESNSVKTAGLYARAVFYYNGTEISSSEAMDYLKAYKNGEEQHFGKIKFVRCGQIDDYTNYTSRN